jgi:hypothetical protein
VRNHWRSGATVAPGEIQFDAPEAIQFAADPSILVGLLVNELVSNANVNRRANFASRFTPWLEEADPSVSGRRSLLDQEKLSHMTADEIQALEERIEMMTATTKSTCSLQLKTRRCRSRPNGQAEGFDQGGARPTKRWRCGSKRFDAAERNLSRLRVKTRTANFDCIREHRGGSCADILVVIISQFGDLDKSNATIKNALIRQEADEAFSQFEARVRATARSAAMQVIPILVPIGRCRRQSVQIDELTTARWLSELTGSEIVALANNGIPRSIALKH